MQLSWFALSTHKQEIPKNLNEIQHKRQQNTVANYIYTRGLKHSTRGYFVRPVLLFGSFQIINIQVILFIHRCLKVLDQRVNNFLLNEHRDG